MARHSQDKFILDSLALRPSLLVIIINIRAVNRVLIIIFNYLVN